MSYPSNAEPQATSIDLSSTIKPLQIDQPLGRPLRELVCLGSYNIVRVVLHGRLFEAQVSISSQL